MSETVIFTIEGQSFSTSAHLGAYPTVRALSSRPYEASIEIGRITSLALENDNFVEMLTMKIIPFFKSASDIL